MSARVCKNQGAGEAVQGFDTGIEHLITVGAGSSQCSLACQLSYVDFPIPNRRKVQIIIQNRFPCELNGISILTIDNMEGSSGSRAIDRCIGKLSIQAITRVFQRGAGVQHQSGQARCVDCVAISS